MDSYVLVSGYSRDRLQVQVNEHIAVGYIPCGNIFVHRDEMIQPMIDATRLALDTARKLRVGVDALAQE